MVRDAVAAAFAVLLVFVALGLATSLTKDRRQRRQSKSELDSLGQDVLAEIPTDSGTCFFTEDKGCFHYDNQPISKSTLIAARVLINGAPIAASIRSGHEETHAAPEDIVDDRPEGLSRDRWDVSIETTTGAVLVECGSIRERISQDLARRVFSALKKTIESQTPKNI